MFERYTLKEVSVETISYPSEIEVKSACSRSSSLLCEARPDKRSGAVHQHDPKTADLSLGMATRETFV